MALEPHSERWQLSDSAAETYEQNLVPVLFRHWATDLIARTTLRPEMRILDAACGTGIVARLVAQQVGHSGQITGVDLSSEMLEVARKQTVSSGLAIDWIESDVVDLPCEDASFDVVFCQQSLQFFSEKLDVLKELRRVLAPSGQMALNLAKSLPHNPYIHALAGALEHHLGSEAGATMRAPCSFGDAELIRNLMIEAAFDNPQIETAILMIRHPNPAEFISRQLAATPVAAGVASLSSSVREALVNDILSSLEAYISEQGLAVPYETHVAVAYAQY